MSEPLPQEISDDLRACAVDNGAASDAVREYIEELRAQVATLERRNAKLEALLWECADNYGGAFRRRIDAALAPPATQGATKEGGRLHVEDKDLLNEMRSRGWCVSHPGVMEEMQRVIGVATEAKSRPAPSPATQTTPEPE